MKQMKIFMVLTLVFGLMFLGCSKLNQENYGKIKMGMKYEQVIEIIGTPDECDSALGAKKCVWGNEEKNITITFMGDAVIMPSMKGL